MKKKKRIFAWIGIIFLCGLYVATLILALIDSAWAFDMFKMCLGFTIIIPVLLYAYTMLHRVLNSGDNPQSMQDKEKKK